MKLRTAFTLIELLVVIAIIALLVSILMPSLQKAKELAKDIVCKSNQKSVGTALFLYAGEYNGVFPRGHKPEWARSSTYIPFSWHVKIGKIPVRYINKNWQEWPLAEHRFPIPGSGYRGDPNTTEFKICEEGYIDYLSWGDNEIVPFEGSFVCPAFVDQVNPKSTWPGGTSCQFTLNAGGQKVSDVRVAAVLMGDGNLNEGGKLRVVFNYSRVPRNHLTRAGELRVLNTRPGFKGPDDFGPWTHQRHGAPWSLTLPCDFYGHPGERANITHADGHVEAMAVIDHKAWRTR